MGTRRYNARAHSSLYEIRIEALRKSRGFDLRVCLKKWDVDQEQLLQASGVVSLSDRRAHAKLSH